MKSSSHDPFRPGRTLGRKNRCDGNRTNRPIDDPPPLPPQEEPEEPSDLDDFDLPRNDDDAQWDVFIPDDDERDPLPDPSDFWGSTEPGARSREPD